MVVGAVDEHEPAAADAARVGLDDAEDPGGRDGRVDGVATGLQALIAARVATGSTVAAEPPLPTAVAWRDGGEAASAGSGEQQGGEDGEEQADR